MPIIQSAIKKLRQDKDRTLVNIIVRERIKKSVRAVRRTPTLATLKVAFSELDTAAKKHVIHKNKADRLKSRLSKLLVKPKAATATA